MRRVVGDQNGCWWRSAGCPRQPPHFVDEHRSACIKRALDNSYERAVGWAGGDGGGQAVSTMAMPSRQDSVATPNSHAERALPGLMRICALVLQQEDAGRASAGQEGEELTDAHTQAVARSRWLSSNPSLCVSVRARRRNPCPEFPHLLYSCVVFPARRIPPAASLSRAISVSVEK